MDPESHSESSFELHRSGRPVLFDRISSFFLTFSLVVASYYVAFGHDIPEREIIPIFIAAAIASAIALAFSVSGTIYANRISDE